MANTWLAGPNFPVDDVGTTCRGGVVVGDNFYVLTSNTLYKYDTLAEVWTQLSSCGLSTGSRAHGNLVSLGAYLYTNGGLSTSPTRVARYGIVNDTWDEVAPMIGIRYFARLAVANGKLYSFYGGSTKLGVEEYTPETNTWVAKGNVPNVKASPFTATVKNKVHLIGGLSSDPKHDIYDPATDSWTSATDIVRASANAYYGAAATFGKYIFTLPVADNEFWVYDTVAGTWTQKLGPSFAGDPKSFAASDALLYAQYRTGFKIYTPDVVGGIASFFPDDGATITPAPEPLPHTISAQDTAGNIPFQRKLQENFESIQRQLMALDPDNQNTSDPQR